MIGATTLVGIASIFIGFVLIAAAFVAVMRERKGLAVVLGVAALVFITFIPVGLALFFAVPNPV